MEPLVGVPRGLTMLHSIFALELCLRVPAQSPLPGLLRDCLLRQPTHPSYQDKWTMYRQACDLLTGNLGLLVKGCWDFFDDDARARKDYDMWSNGMITEEGARGGPSVDSMTNRPIEPRYLTATMAFLLVQGTPTERWLASHCSVPQDRLWARPTFAAMLQVAPRLNYAAVKSDVFYVIPGDDRWALVDPDLQLPKFHYLRDVVG